MEYYQLEIYGLQASENLWSKLYIGSSLWTFCKMLMMRAALALVSTLTLEELGISRSKEYRQSAGRKHVEKQRSKSRGENRRAEAGCSERKDKGLWKDEGNWRIRKWISLFSSGLCKMGGMPFYHQTDPRPVMFPSVRVLPEQVLFFGNRKVSSKAS